MPEFVFPIRISLMEGCHWQRGCRSSGS